MKANAWPFLVSRNRILDYRLVVAPDFLVEAQTSNRLIRYVEADATGNPTRQDVRDPELGDLTVVYRVAPAIDGERKYEDHVGRQILWIEGVVLKGTGATLTDAVDVLSEAHERVSDDYRSFWDNAANASIKKSNSFSAEVKQKTTSPLPTQTPTPSKSPLRPHHYSRLWLTMLVLIGAVVVMMAINFLDKTAPDINNLKDANNNTYSLVELKNKYVLLIIGDSSIRREVDNWAKAFWDEYKANEKVMAFVIIDKLKTNDEHKENYVVYLLDPDGEARQSYNAKREKPCLFLISNGKIVFDLKEKFSKGHFQELQKRINEELQSSWLARLFSWF